MEKTSIFLLLLSVMASCGSLPQNAENNPKSLALSDTSVIAKPVDYQFDEAKTFKVLSWNVEHFVDPYDDPYISHPREDNPSEKMGDKVKLLVKALRKADADVVVFQEFESEKYLMQLAKDSFPELGYQFFSDAASPNWYMNVVMMSRFPLGVLKAYGDVNTPVTGYVDEEGKRQTQSYINTRMWTVQVFPAPEYEFWLTGVHLKAGGGERNRSMRLGQIHFLQREFAKLQQLNPKANLMMAGDFNSYLNSEEIKQLTDEGRSEVPMIDHIDSTVLSHPSDNPNHRLDYMLVNANMEKELAEESVQVVRFFSTDSMRMVSDHLPVMGEFYRGDRD